MVSNHNSPNNGLEATGSDGGSVPPLTPSESILIAALRTGDAGTLGKVMLELHNMQETKPGDAVRIGEAVLKEWGPLADMVSPTLNPYLDSAQRLALHIIAHLGLTAHFPQRLLDEDDGHGLFWLYRDIAEAIKTGLPQVDHQEIQKLMQGRPID